MYREIRRVVKASYRKNKDDLVALVLRRYPPFVYHNRAPGLPTGQIPVFAFHSVSPMVFEMQVQYLAQNGYVSLGAEHFYEILIGKKPPQPKGVVLTFDDGRGSLWSVAFPLLKKYGLCAVAFVVPGAIPEKPEYYPNLEDVWSGRASIRDIELREEREPLCTWAETQTMSRSGVIDFQSHTTYHHSVFVNDVVFDFINPSLCPSFLAGDFNPAIRHGSCDVFFDPVVWGQPVYDSGPTMKTRRRYLEDGRLNHHCTEFVKGRGGVAFFGNQRWRTELTRCVDQFEQVYGKRGRFQSLDERFADIYEDLSASRNMIELHVEKPVNQLCYPWYEGSELAVQASKDAGYVANHWGLLKKQAINMG